MCLLVVLSRVIPGASLVVPGNRDESFDRPALAMISLSETPSICKGPWQDLPAALQSRDDDAGSASSAWIGQDVQRGFQHWMGRNPRKGHRHPCGCRSDNVSWTSVASCLA